MLKTLLSISLLCFFFTADAQTFIKDIYDVNDVIYQNAPTAATYAHGHGAVISSAVEGSPTGSGIYRYNYMIHVNDNGDSLWVKRNILDSNIVLGIGDTFQFQGLVQSVFRLNNGNYVVAGTELDATDMSSYMIRQFDSMGNYISGFWWYDSTARGEGWLKAIAADSNNFYVLYGSDSAIYSSSVNSTETIGYILKMDENYNVLWSKTLYYYSYGSNVGPGWGCMSDFSVFTACDGGLVYERIYDTSFLFGVNKQYLEWLRPDGSLRKEIDFENAVNNGLLMQAYSGFGTHDSCIVCIVYSTDSIASTGPGGYYSQQILKFGTTGALVDSVTDSVVTCGVELSNNNYLFSSDGGIYTPGFNLYTSSLSYLHSIPYPFTENGYQGGYNPPMIANPWGGAFMAYSGDNNITTSAFHIVAINFDSLFQCYPSFVNGNIYQDNNINCINDAGDLNIGGSAAHLHDAITGNDYYGYTNASGLYSSNVPNGNYTVSHTPFGYDMNECGGYVVNVSSPSTFSGNNFADTLIPGIRDLLLWMNSTCLVPGYTTYMTLQAFNNGTVAVDTTMILLLPPGVIFLSSAPAPIHISGDTLSYQLNLLSDSSTYVNLNLFVSTTAAMGDTMTFTAISPFADNVSATDDSVVYQRLVASSFDPNSKSVNQPLYFHRNDEMIYTIEFQNTGTYSARNIVIIDTIDMGLDPTTFMLLGGKPMTPEVSWKDGNRLYMRFAGINLPDSMSNPAGSVGTISYGIKVKASTPTGDTIYNKAYIFFDYNSPVVTNETSNIISTPSTIQPISNNGQTSNNSSTSTNFLFYPNPSQGVVNISIPSSNDIWNVSIEDMSGHTLNQISFVAPNIVLDLNYPPGMYIVQLTNAAKGTRIVKKLVIMPE